MTTKITSALFALTLAFVSLGTPSAQADYVPNGQYGYTKSNLNLRTGPGTGYRRILTVPAGGRVYVNSKYNSSWYNVTYSGNRGYVYSAYLSQSSTTSSSGSSKGDAIAQTAKRYVGSPYVWGAEGPNAFDCSGFTQAMHRYNGVSIPRGTKEQAYGGRAVSKSNIRPGDVIIFQNTGGRSGISHVGLYVGGGDMVHAGNPTTDTTYADIWSSYYQRHYWGVRRYT